MSTINRTDLRGVDLNLLVAFDALMQTRSVTKAAERLRVGQPSASHALKRLRALFGDPLFVRTPAGMAPTPRALALDPPIRSILSSIEMTLTEGPAFDPGRASRVFRIGALDYAQAVIAAPLMSVMQRAAPDCRLILTAIDCDSAARALERGDIDVAVGAFPDAVSGPHRKLLYREQYRCVFDARACRADPPLTRAQWLALPHVIMSTRADHVGPLDDIIRTSGDSRDVVVSTPNFLAIPYLLTGARLVATMPARLADLCGDQGRLSVCAPPIPAPEFDVVMLWHARTDTEPGAVWLRDQIEGLARTLS